MTIREKVEHSWLSTGVPYRCKSREEVREAILATSLGELEAVSSTVFLPCFWKEVLRRGMASTEEVTAWQSRQYERLFALLGLEEIGPAEVLLARLGVH